MYSTTIICILINALVVTKYKKGKEDNLAKQIDGGFIKYSQGEDFGPYKFRGSYGITPVTHSHNVAHTHLAPTIHRQPAYGIRRAFLKR